LEERGELNRLYRDHLEIDSHLRAAGMATDAAEAARLLKMGLTASREHFRREECTIFPLIEKLLSPAALETLAAAAGGSSYLADHSLRTERRPARATA
jgi:hypothetical protein